MDSVKPALDALEALITDVERSLAVKDEDNKLPNNPSLENNRASNLANPNSASVSTSQKKKKKEKKPKQPPPPSVPLEVAQFLQCDLRVGKVIQVNHHPEADGLFVLTVSYGDGATKTVCAGLRKFLSDEQMCDRNVVTICNLKPRKLRGVASEAMVLAASVVSGDGEKETVEPIMPPESAQPGAIVGAEGMEGERTVVEGKYVSGKTWDKVVPRLVVKQKTACYFGAPLTVSGSAVTCSLPDGAEIH